MDEKILKQQIGKWNEACRFLKSQQDNLSAGEWSAIELLADFWRDRRFDTDFVAECEDLIKTLTDSDKYHASHRDIIEWSKTFRGIARQMYTKDEATYTQFQKGMKAFTREHTPRNRQQPQERDSAPPTGDNTALMKLLKQNVIKFHTAVNYLHNHEDLLDEAEKDALNFIATCWFGDWSEEDRRLLEACINLLSECDKLHSNHKELIVYSKECRGIAKQYGLKDKTLFEAFSKRLVELTESMPPSPRPETPLTNNSSSPRGTSIRITGVTFADGDIQGNLLSDFGTTLRTNMQYLTPRITYEVTYPTTTPKNIWYKILSPSGNTVQSADGNYKWTATLPGNTGGSVIINGCGSDNGTIFREAGTWRIEFYEGDYYLYRTTFRVEQISMAEDMLLSMARNDGRYDSLLRTPPTKKKKKKKGCFVWGIVAVIVAAAAYFGYNAYQEKTLVESVPHGYVFANELVLRSSKSVDRENRLGTIPYGTKMPIYTNEGGWAYVEANRQKGYVSSDFLLNETDFALLDGVWGNEEAKDMVNTSKCRVAMLDFIKKNGLSTGSGGWQLFTKAKEMKPNSVTFPQLKDGYDSFSEFAFILKDNATGQRRSAVYAFREDETPVLRYYEDAPESGDIKSVSYSRSAGKYKFSYTRQGEAYVPTTRREEDTARPISISSVTFANADYNRRILTEYGQQLYSDIQYLQPRITYKKRSANAETLKLQVKIIRPDGTLLRGSTSPEEYTFEENLTLSGREGNCVIMGWGNKEGTAYPAGTYRYEIWHEGAKIYTTNIDVVDKKLSPESLEITAVVFANTDYDGNVLTDFGKQLYTDIQYLQPKISYSKRMNTSESILLQIKVFKPDGTLEKATDSPEGYTFEKKRTLTGTKGVFYLPGWGNSKGNSYLSGNYRYEIWCEGIKMYTSTVNIKSK